MDLQMQKKKKRKKSIESEFCQPMLWSNQVY